MLALIDTDSLQLALEVTPWRARAQRLGVKLTAGHPQMDRKDPFPGGIPLVKGPGGSQHGVPWRGARVMASSESRAPLSAAMTQQSN